MNKETPKSSILIVDDIKSNTELISYMLKDDYILEAATDGLMALECVKKSIPDLILLDVMMPGINGYQLCERLKKDERTNNIPIIFITSLDETEDKTQGFELGAVDYITKPFDMLEVKARVQTHLDLKHSREALQNQNEILEEKVKERTKQLIQTERQAAFSLMIKGIVHNLKNPLQSVLGGAKLIMMSENQFTFMTKQDHIKVTDDLKAEMEEIFKWAKNIYKASERMHEMINSMMAKSHSDKNEELKVIDLNNILQQELDFLQNNLIFKHRMQKNIQLSTKKLMIRVVPGEIAQVFQNLINNSMDAMLNQSKAVISISSGMDNSSVEKPFIWFSVSDNGPGIPEHILPMIFDPFFTTKTRVDEDHSNNPVGTGLGLHWCLEVVKSYDGRIDVNIQREKGVDFIVSLPLY